jgi:hypothetical protein
MDLIDAVPAPPEAKKYVPFAEALEKVKAIAVRVKEGWCAWLSLYFKLANA